MPDLQPEFFVNFEEHYVGAAPKYVILVQNFQKMSSLDERFVN